MKNFPTEPPPPIKHTVVSARALTEQALQKQREEAAQRIRDRMLNEIVHVNADINREAGRGYTSSHYRTLYEITVETLRAEGFKVEKLPPDQHYGWKVSW